MMKTKVSKKAPADLSLVRSNAACTRIGDTFQAGAVSEGRDKQCIRTFGAMMTCDLLGKVERSHLTDHQEFYQFLTYKDDVDLLEKLSQ